VSVPGTSTSTTWQRLAWDSDFFGLEIGRVESTSPTPEELAAAVLEATEGGIDCLYMNVDPGPGLSACPERFGFQLVDVQLTLARSAGLEPPSGVQSGVATRVASLADVRGLGELTSMLAPWSRFAADPNFGVVAAQRMYEEWLRRAAGSDEEFVAVAELEERLVGFVTARRDQPPKIGLLVAARSGMGVGAALILVASSLAGERGGGLQVTTQARNVAAIRLYERHGFLATRTQYVYHCWVKEATR
jgi:dTDP-4-amino-4,6-dideoxy-D-galactose acyltransferase